MLFWTHNSYFTAICRHDLVTIQTVKDQPDLEEWFGDLSIARIVLQTGEPLVMPDNQDCLNCVFRSNECSCMWLPLRAGNDVIGVMAITYPTTHDFANDHEKQVAEIMAAYLASAMARTGLIKVLQKLGSISILNLSKNDMLRSIAELTQELLNVHGTLIWGFDEHDDR